MTLQEIKDLANSPRYTASIKDLITKEANKYGIVIPNCKCRNKWHDALMHIYYIEKKKQEKAVKVVRTSNEQFKYKKSASVRVDGKIYSDVTPIDDILRLKNTKRAVFDALFIEVDKFINKEKEEEKTPTSETVVEFYPQNNIGTIREEVSNALGNEIE